MSEQPTPGEVLESGKRLSASSTWRLQREFFERAGERAWSPGRVPFHITSNAYIAESYVRVALRFIEDCIAAPAGSPLAVDSTKPIYIVELGSGHGYFGYLFLCKLLELRQLVPFAMPRVCYVLTDFTESNLQAWRKHPRLEPFFSAGMLDLARFDAERDREIRLERSGVVLSPSSRQNPMLFVANYVFDSLVHDVFRIHKGQLEEGLATLRLVRRDDAREQEMLEHVEVTYDYQPVADPSAYYPEEPLAGRVLADYARRLGDTAFTFPLGGMRCLQHLAAIASARFVMLTADKGHARELDLLGLGDPSIAHHSSVSMMVNYHALGEMLKLRGGFMLAQEHRAAALEVCVLALVGGHALRQTRLAFEEVMERVGPTDIYRMFEHLAVDKMDLDQLLSVLRMVAWDPISFITLSRDLHRCASGDTYVEQLGRLRQALAKVWALHFPLPDGKDVAFELGYVYYAMRRYRESMAFYERSIEQHGEHHVTLFNMGLCEFQQGRLDEALAYFERALARDETYAPARDWRVRVLGERARAASGNDGATAVAADPVREGLAPTVAEDRAAPVVVGVSDSGKHGLAPGVA
jgi:tetratricopeptide (TPR) repeat protein